MKRCLFNLAVTVWSIGCILADKVENVWNRLTK